MYQLKTSSLITAEELSFILNIRESTIKRLARSKQIPCVTVNRRPRFSLMDITAHFERLEKTVAVTFEDDKLLAMRLSFEKAHPRVLQALHIIDSGAGTRKGFNLVKRDSKRSASGFLYYVRYPYKGKYLPSKWNTHTNRLEEAERFARENKERIINRYLEIHGKKLYKMIENFYDSPDYIAEEKRSQKLNEDDRKKYRGVIKNKFLPFLKSREINTFDRLTARTLEEFQDWLLAKKLKPQTVNNYFKAVKRVTSYLARKGMLPTDPSRQVKSIPVRQEDQKPRGCYEIEKLRGVFSKEWNDELSYLLCLIIYTTGLRNGEISRIKLEDIVKLGNAYFINVKESKTSNGLRMVPLHSFVYEKIISYAEKKKRVAGSAIFRIRKDDLYSAANMDLAEKLNVSREELEKERIVFYSGRHFWKTLMSSEGLGEDVEEFFMGHKVSSDVAKLYNHRDKQGEKRMVKKAREVFSILDKCVFTVKA